MFIKIYSKFTQSVKRLKFTLKSKKQPIDLTKSILTSNAFYVIRNVNLLNDILV